MALGCGPQGPGTNAPGGSTSGAASAEAGGPNDPQRVEGIADVACEVDASNAPLVALDLFASQSDALGGRPIARYELQSGKLTLGVGDSDLIASLESSTGGVEISALVRLRDVPLWVKPSRRLLGGMLIPGPESRAVVVRADPKTVRVRLAQHPFLDPPTLALDEAIACDDLQGFPPEEIGRPAGENIQLKKGTALLPSPDAEAEDALPLVLPPSYFSMLGVELERRGDFVRVELTLAEGSLTGWVPSSAVMKSGPQGITGGPRGVTAAHSVEAAWTCSEARPFAMIAPAGNVMVWLGEARANTAIGKGAVIADLDPTWTSVNLRGLEGRAVMRTSQLADCKPK